MLLAWELNISKHDSCASSSIWSSKNRAFAQALELDIGFCCFRHKLGNIININRRRWGKIRFIVTKVKFVTFSVLLPCTRRHLLIPDNYSCLGEFRHLWLARRCQFHPCGRHRSERICLNSGQSKCFVLIRNRALSRNIKFCCHLCHLETMDFETYT